MGRRLQGLLGVDLARAELQPSITVIRAELGMAIQAEGRA